MLSGRSVSTALLLLALSGGATSIARAASFEEENTLFPHGHATSPLAGAAVRSRANDDLDYGRFSLELLAYLVKEIAPHSDDEYPRSSIPAHLSEKVPPQDSNFRAHCRSMLERMSRELLGTFRSNDPSEPASPSDVAPIAATIATLLVVRDVAAAFRSSKSGQSSLFVFEPKVDIRRVGLRLGIRW